MLSIWIYIQQSLSTFCPVIQYTPGSEASLFLVNQNTDLKKWAKIIENKIKKQQGFLYI